MPESTTEVDDGAITPKQLALKLGTNARTIRKFLRTQYGKVGQGNRWGVDEEELPKFVEAWTKWRRNLDKDQSTEIEEPDGKAEDEMEVD